MVLEALHKGTDLLAGLAIGITSPYGTSVRGRERLVDQYFAERDWARYQAAKWEEKKAELLRIQEAIARLKQAGFIQEAKNQKQPFVLSPSGLKQLFALRRRHEQSSEHALPHYRAYERIASPRLIIFVYDIPVAANRKRNWIRAALEHLGFKKIQKSVWVGKIMLPDAFAQDIVRLDLFSCIEIFEITSRGTLRKQKLRN